MIICFPGRALSNDLKNLPTVAFLKGGFGSGAGTCVCAFCFAIERSKIGFVNGGGIDCGSLSAGTVHSEIA